MLLMSNMELAPQHSPNDIRVLGCFESSADHAADYLLFVRRVQALR